jgi:hypothetical protein
LPHKGNGDRSRAPFPDTHDGIATGERFTIGLSDDERVSANAVFVLSQDEVFEAQAVPVLPAR